MREGLPHGRYRHGRRPAMIRVKVFAPAWCSHESLDERGWMELPEGSRLTDVLSAIRMPKVMAKLFHAAVNGEVTSLATVLHDGDIIGFFSLITGG